MANKVTMPVDKWNQLRMQQDDLVLRHKKQKLDEYNESINSYNKNMDILNSIALMYHSLPDSSDESFSNLAKETLKRIRTKLVRYDVRYVVDYSFKRIDDSYEDSEEMNLVITSLKMIIKKKDVGMHVHRVREKLTLFFEMTLRLRKYLEESRKIFM